MDNIKIKIKELIKYKNIKDIVISNVISGTYSGYVELLDGFKIGFIFGLPDWLSFTMSMNDMKNEYKKYLSNLPT